MGLEKLTKAIESLDNLFAEHPYSSLFSAYIGYDILQKTFYEGSKVIDWISNF